MADAQGGLTRPGSLLPRPERTCRAHSARSPRQLSSVPERPRTREGVSGACAPYPRASQVPKSSPRAPPPWPSGAQPGSLWLRARGNPRGFSGAVPGAANCGWARLQRGSGELLGGWSSFLPSPTRTRPISARQVGSARLAAARAPAAAQREARASQHFPRRPRACWGTGSHQSGSAAGGAPGPGVSRTVFQVVWPQYPCLHLSGTRVPAPSGKREKVIRMSPGMREEHRVGEDHAIEKHSQKIIFHLNFLSLTKLPGLVPKGGVKTERTARRGQCNLRHKQTSLFTVPQAKLLALLPPPPI